MKHIGISLMVLLLSIPFVEAKQTTHKQHSSDDQIAEQIIQESISSYYGNCPCPYSQARNGSRCGRRSAYSRPGGEDPVCYRSDVTNEMINMWKQEHKPTKK